MITIENEFIPLTHCVSCFVNRGLLYEAKYTWNMTVNTKDVSSSYNKAKVSQEGYCQNCYERLIDLGVSNIFTGENNCYHVLPIDFSLI